MTPTPTLKKTMTKPPRFQFKTESRNNPTNDFQPETMTNSSSSDQEEIKNHPKIWLKMKTAMKATEETLPKPENPTKEEQETHT